MDDAFGVGCVQRVGDLDAVFEPLFGLLEIRCLSVCPSSNSMAMKGCPAYSSIS